MVLSPSVRRAWIEIVIRRSRCHNRCRSPSVRRAWIEIDLKGAYNASDLVALREEGVD